MTSSRSHRRGRDAALRRKYTRSYKKRSSSGRGKSSNAMELGLMGSLVGVSALTQGTELQQGSFQEQQEMIMGGGKGRHDNGCGNKIAEHILCFLELLNTIKIYHWSTLAYSTHKATDELHGKLSELVDSFIEIYIGHCSRRAGAGAGAGEGEGEGAGVPVFRFKSGKSASIPFCECKSLAAFCKVLDDNIVHLESITDSLNGFTDLVNIRDEMVGALAQALYLLRLK